jgi:hypothetical protein
MRNAVLEMKRRCCYFCLAFFSVTIVVAATAVSQSIIDRAPIIFLKTAEGPSGEIDIRMVPSAALKAGFYLFKNSIN